MLNICAADLQFIKSGQSAVEIIFLLFKSNIIT